jgi:hypothetical protein
MQKEDLSSSKKINEDTNQRDEGSVWFLAFELLLVGIRTGTMHWWSRIRSTEMSRIFHPKDRRQYLTIREDGAESLQDLLETAGLPKYLYMIFRYPAFFVSACFLKWVRGGDADGRVGEVPIAPFE